MLCPYFTERFKDKDNHPIEQERWELILGIEPTITCVSQLVRRHLDRYGEVYPSSQTTNTVGL